MLCNTESFQSCYVAGITFTLTFTGNQPQALYFFVLLFFFTCHHRNELLLSRLIRRDNTAGVSHPRLTRRPSSRNPPPSEEGTVGSEMGEKSEPERRGVQFGSPNLLCIGSSLMCVCLLGGEKRVRGGIGGALSAHNPFIPIPRHARPHRSSQTIPGSPGEACTPRIQMSYSRGLILEKHDE